MIEVRFAVDNPDNWIKQSATEDSSSVRIMEVRAPKRGNTESFVELSSEKTTPEELLIHLREHATVVASDLAKIDKTRVAGSITTHDCPVCSTFAELNCFLVSASSRHDGRMEWRLFISGDTDLKTLCERLDRNRVKYEILEITHHLRKREITSRQEQILRVAFDLGFFEFPKRINLEELCEKLNITPGTLSEILRRAEKHILSNYFGSSA